MRSTFPVLLVDDGELDDVRDLLSELGVDFAHLRGGAVPPTLDPPRDLFVTTGRRASLADTWPAEAQRPVRIGVVSEDSETLRAALRRMGFSYLVRRPVHPSALRLLLLHALYRGLERRTDLRVPVGYTILVRSRLRRRSALLAELSTRGARLVLDRSLAPGTRITLELPSTLGAGEALTVRGRVLRCDPLEEDEASVALAFDEGDTATRDRLAAIVETWREGPPPTPERSELSARARAPRRRRRTGAPGRAGRAERRRRRRVRYPKPVVALAGPARRVLVGRDLSAEGMRVEPHPDLTMGARVRLAVYDTPHAEPLLVNALVVRDDGPRGLALRFEGVPGEIARRLEALVAMLPTVEPLADGEAGALGAVLTEIVS